MSCWALAPVLFCAAFSVATSSDWDLRYSVRFPEMSLDAPLDGVPMTLETGERYLCQLPSAASGGGEASATASSRRTQDLSPAVRAEVASVILSQAFSKKCYLRLSGWWVYEFCYGRYVRQFHNDETKGVTAEYHLGYHEEHPTAEGDTKHIQGTSPTPPPAAVGAGNSVMQFGKDATGPYYAVTYLNGTKCDVSGEGRTTEVRFYCSASFPYANNYFTIDEPRSCHYVVSFFTNFVCELEEFAAPKERRDTITCHRLPVPGPEDLETAPVPDAAATLPSISICAA